MLNVGDPAPDFEAPCGDGRQLRLRDFRGRRHVVLYFFPRDFTPGCTKEACSFRDRRAEIATLEAEVVGISFDTAEQHAAFANQYSLPYPLVSDTDGRIAAKYGVTRLGGWISWLPPKRITFVIDKKGTVRHVIQSEFSIDRHIDEAIDTLRGLEEE